MAVIRNYINKKFNNLYMVDIKLLSFIKDGLNKGYSHNELRNILKDNGWSDSEIEEALSTLKNSIKTESKPLPIQKKVRGDPLTKFIKSAYMKGAREHEIRLALLSKGWPAEKINDTFNKLKQDKSVNRISKKKEEFVGYGAKEEISDLETTKKEKKSLNIDGRKILIYFLSFILVSLVITGTFMVFYFMHGINNSDITCQSGLCVELKEDAINYASDNLLMAAIISLIVAFAIVLTYAFIPNKDILLWIVNLVYLMFVMFISFLWIKFLTA